jgi:predicted DNA-binding transcriptional regulator AlpA
MQAMSIEHTLKQMIRDTVLELMPDNAPSRDPKLITIADVTSMIGVDESVVHSLIKDKDTNGFPAIRLGQRTIRIDKHRLIRWLDQGGLDNGKHHEEGRSQVSRTHLKAVA